VKRKTYILLGGITLIAALLRLILINAGLDIDDATTVFLARSGNPLELVERIKLYEFGPPLYFMIMSFWVRIFGDSAVSMVVPTIIFGSALIPCVYLLARELFDREDIALTSAFFACVSPLAALYSREARSSTLLVLLSTVAYYYFIRCLKATRKPRLIGLGISTALMLYTNYIGLLMVALMVLNTLSYLMFPFKSVVFKPKLILATLGGALLCFLPWLPVFIEDEAAASFWATQESMNNFLSAFTSSLAATLPLPWNASFVLLTVLLPLFAIIVVWKTAVLTWRRDLINYIDHRKEKSFLLANLLIPIAGYAYITPIVGSQRYLMSYIVCGWIFWAALSVEALTQIAIRVVGRNSTRRNVGVGVICAILLVFSFVEIKDLSNGDRSGLRQVAKEFKGKKYSHSAVLFAPDFDAYTFTYYLTEEQAEPPLSVCYAFPTGACEAPVKQNGYAEALRDDRCVENAMKWIQSVDIGRAHELVVVSDQTEPFGKPMLAKTRSAELLNEIKARYEAIGDPVSYAARGRSFSVQSFKLSEPPD